MREIEFLPEWYPKVRQRKRMVGLQAWITLILIFGLGLWMLLVQRNVYAREHQLGGLRSDLSESEVELQHLEDLLQLQERLSKQDQIFIRIGRPIEMTKVMATLVQTMPQDMALLDLNLETEESLRPASASGTLAAHAQQEQHTQETKLHFRLHGVAPTDVDLAEFIAKLTARPFFKQVELIYSHERQQSGHVLREFEIAFVLDLSSPSSPAPGGGH